MVGHYHTRVIYGSYCEVTISTAAGAIGVDQSANHTGVCVLALDGKVLLSELIEPKVRGTARLVYLYDTLRCVLAGYTAPVGVWESYSMGSVNQPFLLGEVGGIVQIVLASRCTLVEKSSPKALKKFVTGNASASKSQMVSIIKTRWGESFIDDDDNRTDAYGLAQIGRHLSDPSLSQVRAQREVVSSIRAGGPPRKKRSFRTNNGVL